MGTQHDLVIVANRLPVRRIQKQGRRDWKLSPGGLVSALEPVLPRCQGQASTPILEGRNGVWVGWGGHAGPAVAPFRYGGFGIQPVPLSKRELESFYYGFSNRTLWPLYHDAVRWPEYHREWWGPYKEINRRYAEAAMSVAAENAIVWVHDYHLQLVPMILRKARPDLRIGFFLHVPFPPQELFAQLPWRREILTGLLGADVVGFQTKAGAANYATLAKRYAGAKGSNTALLHQGRTVRPDSFPVSIDFDKFEKLARSASVQAEAERFRYQLGLRRKIILGVDRLDYT